jgi:hypothetical protein
MTKIIQAFLSGLLFTFILDYFLFLGIYLHYVQPYGIEVFFNILFADHQNIALYLLCSVVLGYLVMYVATKIKLFVITLLFATVSMTLLPSVGKAVGTALLMKKNVTLHNKKFTFHGDIYYIGRNKITFFDKDLNKVILLDKKEILEDINEF